jgi:hypothetical protein
MGQQDGSRTESGNASPPDRQRKPAWRARPGAVECDWAGHGKIIAAVGAKPGLHTFIAFDSFSLPVITHKLLSH